MSKPTGPGELQDRPFTLKAPSPSIEATQHNAWHSVLVNTTLILALVLAVGVVAYWASLRALYYGLANHNLAVARSLESMVITEKENSHQPPEVVRSRIMEYWQRMVKVRPEMYLCLIDRSGTIVNHSKNPHRIGAAVGDIDVGPHTIGQLLADQQDWCGFNRNVEGERQVIGYHYSPLFDGLIAIHIPARVIDVYFWNATYPWILGMAVIGLGISPLVLGRIHRREAKRREQLAALLHAYQASESRLRTILSSSPECIKLISPSGEIVDMNQAGLRMTGTDSSEDVVGKSVFDLLAPEYHRPFQELHQRVLRGESGMMRYEIDNLRGEHLCLETHAAPVFDDHGRVVGHLAVTRDVTQQAASERALRESEQKFRMLTENAPAYIGIVQEGKRVYANRGLRELAGQPEEQLYRLPPFHMASEDDRQKLMECVERCLAEGSTQRMEFPIRHPDRDQRWCDVSMCRIDFQGRPAVLVCGVDATVRHEAIEALRKSQQQLHDMNLHLEHVIAARTRELRESNAELEAFAHTVSHDLRAPLRAMEGFAIALQEDYGPQLDEHGHEYIEHIVASARRMDELIRDLLAYSRLSRTDLRLTHVDLQDVVHDALRNLEGEIKERRAQVVIPDSLPTVYSHRRMLTQVLTNLLSNAIKFVDPSKRPHVVLEVQEDDTKIRVAVRDNGIGIPQDYQQVIFRIFERLHGIESYPGTGIGLAIVARVCQRLGIAYGLESTPGEGSLFWIQLEKAETHAERPTMSAASGGG
ncbi:MAG: hypothetical protein KatS3mg111_0038 [Pirellulaceae bacterium]|nr:MAG: hypothetical protein KatS3mg111_0038 [Pirellulaceae bacterium]